MDLLDDLEARLDKLRGRAMIRTRRVVETSCGPRVMVDGREMLAFCSNDYLGLVGHQQIAAALREGVDRYGAGSGAAHLISGHSRAHAQRVSRLAESVSPFIPDGRALYFCTGYMAKGT